MPDVSTVMLKQWCVVWQKVDTKTPHGLPRVSSPVEIKCRWLVTDQESVTQDASQEAYPRSIPVAKYVALGSYVWGPGKIADLPASPTYYEVVGTQKVPDLKSRHPAYQITLQKASGTLPALA